MVAALVFIGVLVAAIVFLTRLGPAMERSNDRLDRIAEDMYYEQADRDGVEYPPQFRGR